MTPANGTATITHTANSVYNNATATLTVTEGEPPLLVRNAGDTADITALTVNEGSSSSTGFASYKVKLSSQPSSSVTVHLDPQSTSGDNPGDSNISVSPRSLTFTTQNWNLPQNVKVWATDDDDQINGSRAITHRVNGGGYTNAGSVVLTATEVDDDVPTLTTGSVTATGVTLTIANHTAAWWYKSDTAGATTCTSVAQNTSTATVTGLTPATAYTYTAYSGNACSTSLAVATAAAFTTNGFSVSNLGETDHTEECGMNGGLKCAVGFDTGPATNGYTLHSITAKLRKTGTPSGFTVSLHSNNNGNPTDNALATLSGSEPTSTTGAEYTYTCAGSGCALTNGHHLPRAIWTDFHWRPYQRVHIDRRCIRQRNQDSFRQRLDLGEPDKKGEWQLLGYSRLCGESQDSRHGRERRQPESAAAGTGAGAVSRSRRRSSRRPSRPATAS